MTWRLAAGTVLGLLATGCGPDLTTPGSGDVSGTWHADGPAAGLSDIVLVLTQTSDGTVTGIYSATGTRGQQPCPKTGSCLLSGNIEGVHTVLQVELRLLQAGTFTGQLMGANELRGAMTVAQSDAISFVRVATQAAQHYP